MCSWEKTKLIQLKLAKLNSEEGLINLIVKKKKIKHKFNPIKYVTLLSRILFHAISRSFLNKLLHILLNFWLYFNCFIYHLKINLKCKWKFLNFINVLLRKNIS